MKNATLVNSARTRIPTEVEQPLNEFLTAASHELKTPLTALKLQLQGVRRILNRSPELLLERMPLIAERCEKQVDRLTRLVDELLDATKIKNGFLEVNGQRFDLARIVREIAEAPGLTSVQTPEQGQQLARVASRKST